MIKERYIQISQLGEQFAESFLIGIALLPLTILGVIVAHHEAAEIWRTACSNLYNQGKTRFYLAFLVTAFCLAGSLFYLPMITSEGNLSKNSIFFHPPVFPLFLSATVLTIYLSLIGVANATLGVFEIE